MPQQLLLNLLDGNSPALIHVHLIEEESYLLLRYLGTDIIQKFMEVMKAELWASLKAQDVEQLADIDVLRIYLESQSAHYCFELILDLFVVDAVLIEIAFKDGMFK